MNKNINLKVKGKFHLEQANLTIDNGITDWGMSRLAGHTQHTCYAIAENFYYLFLGSSQAATAADGRHEYTLISPHYERTYSSTGSIEVIHNPETSTTEYEVLPTGDMVVRFKQGFRVYFRDQTSIGELGIGPAYYKSGGPDSSATQPVGWTGPGNWPRTEYVGNVGYTQQRTTEFGKNITVDSSTRLVHNNDAKTAIFSRAVIPGPLAKYNAGTKENIVYECEITIAKEAVGFLTGVSLNLDGVTSPQPSDQLPNNKTFIAQCPFYTLDGARYPTNTVDGVKRRLQFTGGSVSTNDQWAYYGNKQPIPPVFESCAASTPTGPETRGFWMLEFFSAGQAGVRVGDYDTAVPTMSTKPWNIVDSGSNPIDLPCTAQMLFVNQVQNLTRASAFMTATPSKYNRVSSPTSNTWQTTISWQFASDDLLEPIAAISLWRALDENKQIRDEWKGFAGIYTLLQTPWSPPSGRVIELNYTLVWQR